jgi:RNA polymerase sigma-70 factor (ECF subfamily)
MDAGELFRRHAAFVARFVTRLGLHPGDVEDVVQEVFLTAHRQGGFESRGAKATTWLAAIAVRVAANHRRSRRRRRDEANQAGEAALDRVVDDRAGPADTAENRSSLRRVQQALDTLDLDHRTVFVLYELEGLRAPAIAQALDIPQGTVYSRLHAARNRFVQAHEALTHRPRSAGPPRRSLHE